MYLFTQTQTTIVTVQEPSYKTYYNIIFFIIWITIINSFKFKLANRYVFRKCHFLNYFLKIFNWQYFFAGCCQARKSTHKRFGVIVKMAELPFHTYGWYSHWLHSRIIKTIHSVLLQIKKSLFLTRW